MSKFRELGEEFRTVFAGRGKLADSVIPPVVFVIVNAVLGFDYAVWSALALAALPPLPLPPDDLAARRESRFGLLATMLAATIFGCYESMPMATICGTTPMAAHYPTEPCRYWR